MNKEIFSTDEMNQVKEENEPISKKVRFKTYEIGDNFLFPPTTDEYISKTHIARLISLIVDRMDIDNILMTYKGGGTSSYHPRMMLKVWLLGFVYKIYTCRQLESALNEHLAFIWISGNQTPDFRSLNNFRLRLNDKIKELFKQIVQLGFHMGLIKGQDVFVDHTKFEANGNKHKITWRKQVERQASKIDEELDKLFEHIDKLNKEEDEKYGENSISDFEVTSLDPDKIDELVKELNIEIKEKRKEGAKIDDLIDSRKKLHRTKELLKKQKEYQSKVEKLKDRNSFSKTDTDATAMLQKDGVSLKPSYNEGIAVENGFVISYEESDKSSDNVSFKDLMEGVHDNLNYTVENVHGDGAYGNEENSEYLKEKGINNYLKFNTYRSEKSKKWHREKVRKEDFKYLADKDCYVCPYGNELTYYACKTDSTKTGFKSQFKIYEADAKKCSICPYKAYCTTSDKRTIQINENYEMHKDKMRMNLGSEKGKELRKRRGFEVESIFGDRKYNKKYGRFLMRGKKKVEIESGLYYMTHNLRKIHKYMLNNWVIKVFNKNIEYLCIY